MLAIILSFVCMTDSVKLVLFNLLERIFFFADDEENPSTTLEWRIPVYARGASSTWEDTHWGLEQEEELQFSVKGAISFFSLLQLLVFSVFILADK